MGGELGGVRGEGSDHSTQCPLSRESTSAGDPYPFSLSPASLIPHTRTSNTTVNLLSNKLSLVSLLMLEYHSTLPCLYTSFSQSLTVFLAVRVPIYAVTSILILLWFTWQLIQSILRVIRKGFKSAVSTCTHVHAHAHTLCACMHMCCIIFAYIQLLENYQRTLGYEYYTGCVKHLLRK